MPRAAVRPSAQVTAPTDLDVLADDVRALGTEARAAPPDSPFLTLAHPPTPQPPHTVPAACVPPALSRPLFYPEQPRHSHRR